MLSLEEIAGNVSVLNEGNMAAWMQENANNDHVVLEEAKHLGAEAITVAGIVKRLADAENVLVATAYLAGAGNIENLSPAGPSTQSDRSHCSYYKHQGLNEAAKRFSIEITQWKDRVSMPIAPTSDPADVIIGRMQAALKNNTPYLRPARVSAVS